MAAKPYQRATERFKAFGIDLNSPPDAVRPGYYPVLENVRSYLEGIIQSRQGLSVIATVSSTNKTPVHSIRRLNDPATGNAIRLVGIQDTLSFWNSTSTGNVYIRVQYNAADITFSGNPISLIPYRPDQSVASWMYLADSSVMRKVIGYNGQSITGGTAHQVGLAPPTAAPTAELASTAFGNFSVRFDLLGVAPANWVRDNVVLTTAPALTNRIPAGAIVTAALYDSGAPGWISLVLPATTMSVLGEGAQLFVNTTIAIIPLVVHEVYRGSLSTTVGTILYDNTPTNTGVCTIQPTTWAQEIERNSVVLLNGVTYVRVTDVIAGPDNSTSFRCNTGATTIAAGQTLVIKPSVRVYDPTGGIAATNVVADDSATAGTGGAVTSGGAGTATSKTGWVQITTARDFTVFNQSGINRPVTDSSYLHLSFLFSDLSKLNQARIMLDVDNTSLNIALTANNGTGLIRVTTGTIHNLATGDTVFISNHNASTNGTWIITVISTTTFDLIGSAFVANAGAVGTVQPQFKKNFYYRDFSPNDIIPAAKGTQTAIDNRGVIVSRRVINRPTHSRGGRSESDDFGPEREVPDPVDPNAPVPEDSAHTQTGSGDYQWSELRWSRDTMVRVGTDTSRGFADVGAVRLEVTLNDTSTVVLSINSLTVFGSFELDTANLGSPYIYRYRYRVSKTGAVSNWSPATRSGLVALRDQASITVVAPTTAPEVDWIDIQRLGGLNTTWLTTGSTPIGTLTFTDKSSDDAAAALAPLSDLDTNYQLWPCVQKPAASSSAPVTTTVVGPYLRDTNAPFNLAWAKGTAVKVNGIDTQIRRVVTTSIMELDDSLGSLTNPTWEIPAPLLTGQALPCLWVWNDRGFACGDLANPGRLYYTNGQSLDTTQDTFWIDVTSPSEPLQNGCSFNGKNYVWSSERMFEIDQIGLDNFLPLEIPGMKGMIGRWGLAVGERLWWLSKDGIYQSAGGDAISITDETLRQLFVREGNVGVATNGFNPPDLTVTSKLRLSYYDGYLYFIYQDTGGSIRCLTYYTRSSKPGWWPDNYLDGRGVCVLYGEEGSGVHNLLAGGNNVTTAKLYQVSGAADDSSPIASRVLTPYFDGGDMRAEKRWGDLIVDADTNNATLNFVVCTNGSTSAGGQLTLTPATMTNTGRGQEIVDLYSGSDPLGDHTRNAALEITWTSTSATPKLFLWEPSYITRPERSEQRATQWDDAGVPQDKYFQGIEIEANTLGVNKTVVVEYDGSTANVGDTLTVNHTNRQIKAYSFHPPFIAHTVRLHPSDQNDWALYDCKWIFQPESPLADHWQTQQVTFGNNDFFHMREMWVTTMSTQNVVMTVTRVDDNSSTTYTIPTSSGLRLKQRILLSAPASKGKSFIFTFSSTSTGGQFRLYKPETSIFVKPWASEQAYSSQTIFGGMSGQGSAPI